MVLNAIVWKNRILINTIGLRDVIGMVIKNKKHFEKSKSIHSINQSKVCPCV